MNEGSLEVRLGVDEEVRRQLLLEGLRDFIQGFPGWNIFITQTFAHSISADRSDMAIERVQRFLESSLRRPHGFLGAELHRSGTVHLHGLIGASGDVSRKRLWERLHRRFGFSRIEPVRSHEQVTAYCTKYVTKRLAEWVLW